MCLRNKKTGKIINGGFVVCEYKDGARFSVKDKPCFDSLDELKEEWEDCEEPFWYISQDGLIYSDNASVTQEGYIDRLRLVGNYFETKEEAKKALEKLKAWKTLRDNKVHFDFATLADETTVTIFARKNGAIHEYDKELFLLFGENSEIYTRAELCGEEG